MRLGNPLFFAGLSLIIGLVPLRLFADLQPAFGVQAGLTVSTFSTPGGVTTSNYTGWALGAHLEMPLVGSFYVQPELMYLKRGSSLVDSSGVRLTASYDSIELPLLFKVKIGEVVRPVFFLGPDLIFNISKSLTVDSAGRTSSVAFDPNTIDFAAVFGVGVEFSPFFANVRYQLGLVDVNESATSWKARGFLLLAGLRF